MTDEYLYQQLTSVLRDVFDDDTLVATPQLRAADVSAWDSLNHIRLMLSIERAFSVNFRASDVASFENMGDLVAVLKTKLG